jgi:hypothetical protein
MMMEDREAAHEELQASIAALQSIAAGERNNNHGDDHDNNGDGDRCLKVRDFQNTNPPVFSTCKDPPDIDDWLRTIENDLQVSSVGDNEKVLYGTHYLAGQAQAWWISI